MYIYIYIYICIYVSDASQQARLLADLAGPRSRRRGHEARLEAAEANRGERLHIDTSEIMEDVGGTSQWMLRGVF